MTSSAKNKHKFNIIDLLIIIAVIAAGIFAVNFIRGELFGVDSKNAEYIIRITGASTDSADSISVGNKLYASDSGYSVGTITDTVSVPQTVSAFSYDTGRFVMSQSSALYTVYIYVSAECHMQNGQLFAGEQLISSNTSPKINIPFDYDKCEIIQVKINDVKGGEQQ